MSDSSDSDWRTYASKGQWSEIHWPDLVGDDGDRGELKLYFEQLCEVVPKKQHSDGLKSMTTFMLPDDIEDNEIKHAALYLNEISEFFDEEPDWLEVAKKQACDALAELGVSAGQTDGMPKPASEVKYLSSEWHALRILELAHHYQVMLSWATSEDDTENDTPSWMAEAAKIACEIGRHVQVSWGKPFEPHTIRGMTVIAGATSAGYGRRNDARTNRIVGEMRRHIDAGKSIDHAAALAAAQGIGTSKAANSKAWYRHLQKNQPLK